ncbi:MAG TPA: molybdate ABC transporter substrate-binding protein [Syntrophomonadaceae bacterium]|nr:molybdate ABC transporter substrate-binding protein [Syntrophomonadaceae bacterium]
MRTKLSNSKQYVVLFVITSILLTMLIGCQKGANAPTDKAVVTTPSSELLISSAPSLKASLEEIKTLYNSKHPDIKITYNYGPSGAIKNQIIQGAATDVFISQGAAEMDELDQKGILKTGSRVNLLSDELVLIVNKNNTSINSFEDLTKPEVKKIGIGEAQTVPAAKIAQQTLEYLKLWDSLQTKLVVGKDLNQITAWVESGDADAGLVWDTIAMTSSKVRVAAKASADTHKPVVLPAAVVAASKSSVQASDFLKFLQSDEAMQVFQKNGFTKAK